MTPTSTEPEDYRLTLAADDTTPKPAGVADRTRSA